MGFVVQARQVRVAPKLFFLTPRWVLLRTAVLMWKVAPSLWRGGNPVARVWMAHVEVLEESCRRWSELEQRNATSLNVCPVRCNDVAWSTPAPHHRRRPSLAPLLSTPTSQHGSAKWADQTSPNQLSSFFAPRILRHGLFFFHSLTSCSLYSPPPPTLLSSSAGVSCFALPPATRGRPRWPTEGGRERGREGRRQGGRGRGTERPLVAEDRLWSRKITLVVDAAAVWKRRRPELPPVSSILKHTYHFCYGMKSNFLHRRHDRHTVTVVYSG